LLSRAGACEYLAVDGDTLTLLIHDAALPVVRLTPTVERPDRMALDAGIDEQAAGGSR